MSPPTTHHPPPIIHTHTHNTIHTAHPQIYGHIPRKRRKRATNDDNSEVDNSDNKREML